MKQMGHDQANTNPKLVKLEDMLIKAFRDEPTSRAIIFVKTRDLAEALVQWMRRRPQLKKLKPGKMVGAGASQESGGEFYVALAFVV
jgi:ERCC4-related helicase